MNDDFLHNHRREPDADFGASLYQQLLDADQTLTPLPTVSARSTLQRQTVALRIAAVILMILAAGVVALQSSNHSAPPNLAQIDTGLLLDDLPLITTANASQLLEVARLGKGRADSIAYSPDGKTLAVSTSNGVALYNADLQSAPRLLRTTHDSYRRPVAISADSRQVATIDGDAVHIWDTTTGAQTALLEVDAHSDLTTLQFSPDGHWLAAGGGTYQPATFSLYVWYALTYERIGTLNLKLVNPVGAIAFSPGENSLLAVQTIEGITALFDPTLKQRLSVETTSNNYTRNLAFSPDGTILAISHQDSIYLWDAHTQKFLQAIPLGVGNTASIVSLTYSPDGSLLAISDVNHGVSVWDLKAAKFLRPPQNLASWQEISNFAFSPDSSKMALIRYGKTISLENARTGAEIVHRTDYDGSALDLSLNVDNLTTVTSAFDGSISFHDLKTGELTKTLDSGLEYVSHIAFSPDGQSLAVSGFNAVPDASPGAIAGEGIKRFDWKSGSEINRFGSDAELLFSFAFAHDGRLFAFNPSGNRMVWWDVDHPDQEHNLTTSNVVRPQDIQFSSDDSRMVTHAGYGNDAKVHIFDTVSGEEITIPGLDQYYPEKVALSPDGSTLALVAGDQGAGRALIVFDLKYHALLYQHPFAPGEYNTTLTFSPDGQLIAVAQTTNLLLFDASNGKPLYRDDTETGDVNALAFSSDGRYIVGSAYDGYIRVWGVPPPPEDKD